MLKNAQSNGYSSKVRGWLVVGCIQYELSQVGPDFCILRQPRAFPQTPAELIVEVDGDQQITPIRIAGCVDAHTRIAFTR